MFWTSAVPSENVLLVNTSEKFVQGRVGETLRGASLVGLDAEWRPSHLAKELHTPPRISILQVACRTREQLPGATWQELREDDSGASTPASGSASHGEEVWDPLWTAPEMSPGEDAPANASYSQSTLSFLSQTGATPAVSPSSSVSISSHGTFQAEQAPCSHHHQGKKPVVASNKARRRKAKAGRSAVRKEGGGVGSPSKEVVFILDMIHLDPQLVLPTLASLFNDPAVLKLGFSFRDDLRMIQSSYAPSTTLSQCLQVHPYIDVGSMYAQMRKKRLLGGPAMSSQPQPQPQPRSRRQRRSASVLPSPSHSLSSLTDHLLGRPLNKQWQCSDWEQRPLSSEQLQYAADDASCLLQIFDKLVSLHPPNQPNPLAPPLESLHATPSESASTTASTAQSLSPATTEGSSFAESAALRSAAASTSVLPKASPPAATATALSSTATSRGASRTLGTATNTEGGTLTHSDTVPSRRALQGPTAAKGVPGMLPVQPPMGLGQPSSVNGVPMAHHRPGLPELACTCGPGAAGGLGIEGNNTGVLPVEEVCLCEGGALHLEEPGAVVQGHSLGTAQASAAGTVVESRKSDSPPAPESRAMALCAACVQQLPRTTGPGALVRVPRMPAHALVLASLVEPHEAPAGTPAHATASTPAHAPSQAPAGAPAEAPAQESEPGSCSATSCSQFSNADGDSKEEAPSARVAALYSNRLALVGGGGRGGGGGGGGLQSQVPVHQYTAALGAPTASSTAGVATVATAAVSSATGGATTEGQPAALEEHVCGLRGTPSRDPCAMPEGDQKGPLVATDEGSKAPSATHKGSKAPSATHRGPIATSARDKGSKAPFPTERGSNAPFAPRQRVSQKKESANLDASLDGWTGPAPWETGPNADNCPRFLCDIMVEGLARQLRCVGIDAASPPPLQPQGPRQLVDWAESEGRVILTRDSKFLRRRLLPPNYTYRVVNKGKQEQLKEVLETFGLRVSEEHLLSRCVRCNGDFITTPLTADEAMRCAPQSIPPCVRENVSEFWKCSKCGHLYWEGSQFDRAVKQFGSICRHLKSKRELILKSLLPDDPVEREAQCEVNRAQE